VHILRTFRSAALVALSFFALGHAAAQGSTISEVTYTMEGFAFEGPTAIPAGMTTLSVRNEADRDDLFALISLSGGRTLEDFFVTMGMLFAGEISVVPTWVNFHGGSPIGPDQTRSYTVFLGPGTYYLLSIEGDDEGPFAARGALLPITVEAPAMHADVTVTLRDYEFVVEGTFVSGSQVVRVHNAANQAHEMLMLPLPPGMSLEDMFAMEAEHDGAAGGEHAEGPPEEEGMSSGSIRGMWAINPGETVYVTVHLDPGSYGIVCFIPDADGPHAMQGMALEITVN
jgi:hypothetical protein